jgi:PAS domain-containing protein
MNNLPGLVYRCKADETYTMEFASQGSVKLLGYGPAELLGSGPNAYQRIVHPQDRKDMLR